MFISYPLHYTMDEFAPTSSSTSRTALIIDDSGCTRRVAAHLLKKHGFETFEAEDGKQGLDMLLTRQNTVCFCDVEMPVMDGIECVRRLREWEHEHRPSWRQPMVCVSSRAATLQGQLLEAGMDSTVQKPLSSEKVHSQVTRRVASAQSALAPIMAPLLARKPGHAQ